MGRKASANLNLPKGMRARKRPRKNGQAITYYYYDAGKVDGKRKEIALGCDYIQAVQRWAKLEIAKVPKSARPTFPMAAARYQKEIMPGKSPKTQRENQYQLNKLLHFFGGSNPAPLEEIQPEHIKQYFTWRKNTPVAANREMALFNHIWTMCSPAHWNYTNRPSPATGITRNTEAPRDVYIEDYLFDIFYNLADQDTKDAMDIAYLTSQRPADTLKITVHHIRNGELAITQNKTKAKLRFAIIGKLKEIIDRRLIYAQGYLICNQRGGSLTVDAMGKRFAKIRAQAIVQFPELKDELSACQFRDLRAKSGTDAYLQSDSVETAQRHLGHTSPTMTKRYIRRDKTITPLQNCGTPAKIAEKSDD